MRQLVNYNNLLIRQTLGIASFFLFFCGIFRDDVGEEEYLKFAMQPQFDCVGKVILGTEMVGSCVLIDKQYVLSAAHCFLEFDTTSDTTFLNGKKVIRYSTSNEHLADAGKFTFVFNEEIVKAKRMAVHPIYEKDIEGGNCDIALFELEKEIESVTPATLNIKSDELNAVVIGVGYGASGSASKPETVKAMGKKIAGENVIDLIEGKKYNGLKTILTCDFDHPTDTKCNKMGSSIPRPMEFIVSGGDSGGGLFRFNGQNWELIGICSGGNVDLKQLNKTGYYGQIMNWTRVSPFVTWINKQKN